jgi:7-cyano-7-deazaguanine synthase in queuosine biosynthesis
MGKTIFVLWSGGADSTYTLQHCIEDDAYDMVLAGYVILKNNPDKADYELTAIGRMLPSMMASGKFAWQGVIAEVSLTKTNPRLMWKQLPLWFFSLVTAVHAPVDEVAVGANRDDFEGADGALPRETFLHIWESYRPMFRDVQPKWVFPVAHLPRRELLARLRPELRAACVYCEAPVREGAEWRACGKCRLCHKHGVLGT